MTSRAGRVLVAGASGVVGRRLVPLLAAGGHDVIALSRSATETARAGSGVTSLAVDALDRRALLRSVVEARPDVVVHQLTSLATRAGAAIGPQELARTARLRAQGSANLVAAAVAAGAVRLVAQSVAWLYAPGPLPHDEDAPLLDADPDGSPTLGGVRELERHVLTASELQVVVLRYGRFYGAGTGTPDRPQPPTVHVEAAAWAAALAVGRGAGIYNVADEGGPVDIRRARDQLGWSPTIHRTEGGLHDRHTA